METQTYLSRHYKSISVENITILSVLSDNFLHAFLKVEEQQMSISQRMNKGLTIAIHRALTEIYMIFLIYSIKI